MADSIDFAKYVDENGELDLSFRHLGDADMSSILDFLSDNPSIKRLNLSHNSFTHMGLDRFVAENTTITKLDLSFNPGIDDVAVNNFALANKKVKLVNFACNHICDAGLANFASNNKVVTEANFSDNEITDAGLASFAKLNKVVKIVFFNQMRLTNKGAKEFAKHNTAAIIVHLERTDIDNFGLIDIAMENNTIQILNLAYTKIGDEGAKIFAVMNKTIVELNLRETEVTELGIKALFSNLTLSTVTVNVKSELAGTNLVFRANCGREAGIKIEVPSLLDQSIFYVKKQLTGSPRALIARKARLPETEIKDHQELQQELNKHKINLPQEIIVKLAR